jgi:hypothetical protein
LRFEGGLDVRRTRLVFIVIALALTSSVANLRAQEGEDWLKQALAARSATQTDFARGAVFTRTRQAQADQLAQLPPLLWAGAAGGATRGRYQRALDTLAESANANGRAPPRLRYRSSYARSYAVT